MKPRPRRVIAALCLCFFLAACGREETAAPSPEPAPSALIPLPTAREEGEYPFVPVYYDGLLSDRGYLYNGCVFINPDQLCAHYGLELTEQAGEEGANLRFGDVELTAKPGQGYMSMDGRYLYTPEDYIIVDGRVCLPYDAVGRIFGINISAAEDLSRVDGELSPLRLLQGGEDYYARRFPQEDLHWLSRIIYSETKDQPLAGLIGVGNVVYNRLNSDDFPDTVFDVIFDSKHTVQFEPAATGGVLGEPDERSVIAACLCLEGYNTVGDSLYFVNPDKGDSGWFEAALEPVVSYGDHDFYK